MLEGLIGKFVCKVYKKPSLKIRDQMQILLMISFTVKMKSLGKGHCSARDCSSFQVRCLWETVQVL